MTQTIRDGEAMNSNTTKKTKMAIEEELELKVCCKSVTILFSVTVAVQYDLFKYKYEYWFNHIHTISIITLIQTNRKNSPTNLFAKKDIKPSRKREKGHVKLHTLNIYSTTNNFKFNILTFKREFNLYF